MADFRILFILLIGLSSTNCQLLGDKGSSSSIPTEIKGGYSFGLCAGYCNSDFVINSTEISLVLKSHGRDSDPPDILLEKALSSVEWDRISNSFNSSTFCSMEDVYGCPDCADGGREYLTLECDGLDKSVNFEYGADLPELRNLLSEIRPLRDSLIAEVQSR